MSGFMGELELARTEINEIDTEMARLFERRMKAVETIARYKKEHGLPVRDPEREAAMFAQRGKEIRNPALVPFYITFLKHTIDVSCSYQEELLSGRITAERDCGNSQPSAKRKE